MAKRSGPSTSQPRTRSKAAEEGSKKKTSESGVEDECSQLRCEVRSLWLEAYKLSEKQRKLEDQKRELEEQLRPLRLEVEQAQRDLLPKSNRLKDVCSAIEAENTKLLDKLPREVWEKILDELKENDLFPLALSCSYFREKQKELVARTRQSGPESAKPHLTLKTNLARALIAPYDGMPASAAYLRFCSEEYVEEGTERLGLKKAAYTVSMAAKLGYLPLLQKLYEENMKSSLINLLIRSAGEYSSSQSSLLLCFGF